MSHERQVGGSYREQRVAAVVCGEQGDENCRHAWNREHPDDPISEEEQRNARGPLEGLLGEL